MKISIFQIVLLSVFGIFIIAGVAAFALYKGSSASSTLPALTVWGTYPADTFNTYVSQLNNSLSQSISITYVQKDPGQFSQDFVSALARGAGPDVILVPADMLLPQEDKLSVIPFSALPQRDFMDTYIDEANIYLVSNGSVALPFEVDPLVMYWNRDSFNAAGIAQPPHYWDDFSVIGPKLLSKDASGNIRKTPVALGDFTNVSNAREILGTLIMQIGNPITQLDQDGTPSSALKASASPDPSPAIDFFTQFTNPTDPSYSWNRGLANSKTAFLAGNLATYFGFASEIADIREKNPNLNFDVAPLPQVRTGGVKATYGRMYGLSIVHSSPNQDAAYQVISILTQSTYLASLAQTRYLPSVRRDVLAQGSNDPYISIFNQAALVAKTWLDADPQTSRDIFGSMIQSVTSGQQTTFAALSSASAQYDVALKAAVK